MKRHYRFFIALLVGAAVAALLQLTALPIELRVLAAANALFVTYLGLMLRFAMNATPEVLRTHAEQTDEGVWTILLLAVLAVAISLTSILLVLSAPNDSAPARVLALGSVPLGWAALQVLAGFHYAHLYYQPRRPKAPACLSFPGSERPGPWDFLYFSFGIGMTAQVADVTTTSTQLRKVVLVHSVGSFFYNTIILALAVNAAVTSAG
ncbi:DUF1345 domain-containing protein [Cypionkella sp. TWP1-2-1b2]|uniref:DUF1345 domain-containing protein n=1 Tax=Cypionkella sp. TWP1-2-1b2 TaxID=2804675 RepID=UPI003CEE1559